MERKLAAIFSTDVKGYSRLMGDDEEATIRTIKVYREVISGLIEQHHGRVVDSPGDNLLAEFASAVDAVKSAVAIQHELKTRNAELAAHRQMEFRIGLNVGDVITDEGRLYGDGVNIAARLESLADPGGICISESVHTQVRNKLSLAYEYIGEREVKNIATPVPVYKVQLESNGIAASQVSRNQPPDRPVEVKHVARRRVTVALAVVVVVLIGAGGMLFWSFSPQLSPPATLERAEESPALTLPDKPSIAVLPFTNMSTDPEQDYFSDGITEDIITDLSKISGLFVIARNSSFTYKGQASNIKQVGQELGVQYVMEGSIRKANDRVRINAQLIDATTGGHVWAERYDRELADIFAVQDEITQKIVFALKVTLTPEEQERLRRYPTDNLEAYDFFLRAGEYTEHATQEGNPQAQRLAEKAIELDPDFASAYALLSFSHQIDWMYQWSEDPQQSLKRATELAQQAVTLDGSLSMPRWVLSWCYLYQRQYEQAIAEGQQAIRLGPNYASAYIGLAEVLNWAGQPQEALRLTETAMRLNPRYGNFIYLFELGHAYYLLGRTEEAMAAFQKLIPQCPNCLGSRSYLASLYMQLGREKDAKAEVAEILRRSPQFSLAGVLSTYKDPAHLERLASTLRKVGLK